MSELPAINLCKACTEVIEKQLPEKNRLISPSAHTVTPVVCTVCIYNNWATLKKYSIIQSGTLRFKLHRED
ncbi:Hypothetical protein PACV_144 [Pacmanvirus A23]|uniref:Hypothetical protein n=1 Tax=Pacmanvirus A23 TaxID=1932881 RepID=UPI000A0949AD|nr:Hypothetical protein B9W72_gp142 [Pacmanvirus A23]SIP85859.1 Hypothetical protein PACV_144 [Pacmanvirus A23]